MKCFNRNVLIGLGVAAAATFFLVPSARSALPLLAFLACPLSMILLMGGMAKIGAGTSRRAADSQSPHDEIAAEDAEIARLNSLPRLNSLLRQDHATKRN